MSAAHGEPLPAPAAGPRLGTDQRSTLAMYEQALWRKVPARPPRAGNREEETKAPSGPVAPGPP
jgi:hypothetical protein